LLERRDESIGWYIVAAAVAALIVFTGLLYLRGSSPAPDLPGAQPLTADEASPGPSGSGLPTGSGAPRSSGAALASSKASTRPAATGAVAGAISSAASSDEPSSEPSVTLRPTPAATRTPRPTPKPTPSPTESPTPSVAAGYQLPSARQAASVNLENGQGGCQGYPTGGVAAETVFSTSRSGALTAISPSNNRLSGRLKADGSFSLSGASPTERWIGVLTATGGSGNYFVVHNGCTEGYDTTIAFHP
jgi:hypothetical protein